MKPIISLIAPCLNEQDNVVELAERFIDRAVLMNHQVEIVFVDDGSTDRTWETLAKLKQQYFDQIQLVRHLENRGIPTSWTSGVLHSNGKYICLIDSDLQNPPEAVFHLLEALEANSVQLARGIRRPVKEQPKSRILMSRTLNWILNSVFGMSSADNKSGFVIGPKEMIHKILCHKNDYRHYQTFIGVAAHSHGLRVIEVDTPFEDRRSGVSFLSGKSVAVVLDVFHDIFIAINEFGTRFRKK